MRVMLVLEHDEIQKNIPYALICETRSGSRWCTGTRRRRWTQEFNESERKAAAKLFHLAHQWYLVKGVPEEVRMSMGTMALWNKLGAFCASL